MYSSATDGLRTPLLVEINRALNVFHRPTMLAHSSGNSVNARIRVRASSPRLVSWVAVAVSPCGQRAGTLDHHPVKTVDIEGRRGGIAADLVEGKQPVIAIEGGVFERLRHHRSGELLDLERKAADPLAAVGRTARREQIERQRILQEIKNAVIGGEPVLPRLRDRVSDQSVVVFRRPCRSDVGAVNRKMQDEQLEAPGEDCPRNSRASNNGPPRCAPATASER